LRTCFLFCTAFLFSCSEQHSEYDSLVINEFLTSNTLGLVLDEMGQAEDYIEIYNKSNDPVNLRDVYLSDDSTNLMVFKFPDTVIEPNGFILVWADDDSHQGSLHANFKLSANKGDEIILSSNNRIIDRIQFFPHNNNPQARLPDISFGRNSDGDTLWTRQKKLTPGAPNSGP